MGWFGGWFGGGSEEEEEEPGGGPDPVPVPIVYPAGMEIDMVAHAVARLPEQFKRRLG